MILVPMCPVCNRILAWDGKCPKCGKDWSEAKYESEEKR